TNGSYWTCCKPKLTDLPRIVRPGFTLQSKCWLVSLKAQTVQPVSHCRSVCVLLLTRPAKPPWKDPGRSQRRNERYRKPKPARVVRPFEALRYAAFDRGGLARANSTGFQTASVDTRDTCQRGLLRCRS